MHSTHGVMSFSPTSIIIKPTYEKKTVEVHVTFLKLGEIDTLKECFDADVLVICRWREPELDKDVREDICDIDFSSYWNPKIFIENLHGEPRVTSSIFVEYVNIGDAYVIERKRFKGTFLENLELFDFPFDVQDLSVNVMSDLPSSAVSLVEDHEKVHRIYKQSFIDEQEWYLYKYIESERNEFAKDKVDPSITRSSLLVKCRAARRPAYFIWNIFSVTFLISCLAFVTFAVDSDFPQNRLTLSFTLVLTAVAFKFTVNQSLPRISYLTYLDRYILMNLVLLTIVSMWHGVQTKLMHENKDFYALLVLACLFVLYNLIFILRLIFKPYRKRRFMKRMEANYIEAVKKQAKIENPANGARLIKLPNRKNVGVLL